MTYPLIHTMPQMSDAWFDVKRGKISASHLAQVKCCGKGRGDYMKKLIYERIHNITVHGVCTTDMKIGVDREDDARRLYEWTTGTEVQQVGFIQVSNYLGCSPDGLVGEPGMLEIKCPKKTTHERTLSKKKLPSVYKPQVQGQLWIADREWCDFVSYCPEMEEEKDEIIIIRVDKDEKYVKMLKAATEQFIIELKEKMGV